MTSDLVTSLRDRVQLRSRLRRLLVLYSNAASAPPPAPKNAVDPARLKDLAKYQPEVPGHAAVFLRDAQGLFEPVLDDLTHWDAALAWLLRAQEVTACRDSPAAIVFRTGAAPRSDIPLNRVHAVDRYRSVVQVTVSTIQQQLSPSAVSVPICWSMREVGIC
jgi:hypothetical protein